MKSFRLGANFAITALIALAFSPLASAQATRTWISGVGDDVNPCSRTAPCKTFAGAISKTSTGGEIDCLDPGGFGTLTITKPITLDCGAGVGGILAAGTNGIVVNTGGASDYIMIRNVTLEGSGTGLSGIYILAGSHVYLEHVKIHNFVNFGVQVVASAPVNLAMTDVTITADNATGGGVSMTTTSGLATAELINVRIWNTHPGLQGRVNSVWTVQDSDLSYNGVAAKTLEAGSIINLTKCQINNNGAGAVQSVAGSTIRVMSSTLSQNGVAFTPNGGVILTDGLNDVNGNGSNGSTTGSTTKM